MAFSLIALLLILPIINAAQVLRTTTTSTTTLKPDRSIVRQYNRNNNNKEPRPAYRKGTVEDVPFAVREIFKFELSDARIPTKNNPKELKHLDMDTMGSRIVQHMQPAPTNQDQPRGRALRELPISVQKAISHAYKQNYNLPYLDTVKYYFKEQTQKPIYNYDVGESSKPIVPSSITKLKPENANRPWWQPVKVAHATPKLTSFPVVATTISSTSHRPIPLLKSYPLRYTYKVVPTASTIPGRINYYYGDKLQPKTPYIYAKPLKPATSVTFTEVQAPNFLNQLPEVTTTNSITSTAPVLFPVTVSPFPKNQNPLQSLLKFYSSEQDIHNYFQSKDTLRLIKAAVEALKEQNPHLHILPKGIENNELIVRVTPKSEYLATTPSTPSTPSTPQPVTEEESTDTDLRPFIDPNLTYLTKAAALNDLDVVRILPATVKTIGSNIGNAPKSHAFVNNLQNSDPTHGEYAASYAFGYQVRDHHTGNNFRHTQRQMQDGTTHGEYKILMPDGRTQNVKYKADDAGYHADVTYDI